MLKNSTSSLCYMYICCPHSSCDFASSTISDLRSHLESVHSWSREDWGNPEIEFDITFSPDELDDSLDLSHIPETVHLSNETHELIQKCIDNDLGYDSRDVIEKAVFFFFKHRGDLDNLERTLSKNTLELKKALNNSTFKSVLAYKILNNP